MGNHRGASEAHSKSDGPKFADCTIGLENANTAGYPLWFQASVSLVPR